MAKKKKTIERTKTNSTNKPSEATPSTLQWAKSTVEEVLKAGKEMMLKAVEDHLTTAKTPSKPKPTAKKSTAKKPTAKKPAVKKPTAKKKKKKAS